MTTRMTAVRLRPSSAVAVALVSLAGIVAFGWPLVVARGAGLTQAGPAAWLFVLMLPLLLAGGARGDLRGRCGRQGDRAAGRAGRDRRRAAAAGHGRRRVRADVLRAGAWGAGAGARVRLPARIGDDVRQRAADGGDRVRGCRSRSSARPGWDSSPGACRAPAARTEIAMLAEYGALAALVYGSLQDLALWPFATGVATSIAYVPGAPITTNIGRFVAFDLATSLGFDMPRAVTTAALVAVTGRPCCWRSAGPPAGPPSRPPSTSGVRERRPDAPYPAKRDHGRTRAQPARHRRTARMARAGLPVRVMHAHARRAPPAGAHPRACSTDCRWTSAAARRSPAATTCVRLADTGCCSRSARERDPTALPRAVRRRAPRPGRRPVASGLARGTSARSPRRPASRPSRSTTASPPPPSSNAACDRGGAPFAAPWRTLVLGGARSGKSEEAERRVLDAPEVTYAATGIMHADDQTGAPASPRTASAAPPGGTPRRRSTSRACCAGVRARCLSMAWEPGSTAMFDALGAWEYPARRHAARRRADRRLALHRGTRRGGQRRGRPLGRPRDPSGRAFRDLLGRLNQRLAAESEETALVVAGRVVELP